MSEAKEMKPNNDDLEKLFENEDFRKKFYELAEQYKPSKDRLEMSLDEIRENLYIDDAYIPSLDSNEFYHTSFSQVCEEVMEDYTESCITFEDKDTAIKISKQLLNFNQLIRVRDFLRDGWKFPKDCCEDKYISILWDTNEIRVFTGSGGGDPFTFETEKQAERFLELMKPQLEKYFEDYK